MSKRNSKRSALRKEQSERDRMSYVTECSVSLWILLKKYFKSWLTFVQYYGQMAAFHHVIGLAKNHGMYCDYIPIPVELIGNFSRETEFIRSCSYLLTISFKTWRLLLLLAWSADTISCWGCRHPWQRREKMPLKHFRATQSLSAVLSRAQKSHVLRWCLVSGISTSFFIDNVVDPDILSNEPTSVNHRRHMIARDVMGKDEKGDTTQQRRTSGMHERYSLQASLLQINICKGRTATIAWFEYI